MTLSTSTRALAVELGDRSYDITIGTGLISSAGRHLAPMLKHPRALIVSDTNVAPLYLDKLQESLEAERIASDSIVLPAGESTKDFSHLEELVEAALESRIERTTTLIALGGGVIGDLTGFAASIILRGVDFVQVPTTLLAQVDSSVGGKTGINTKHGKNLAGSFHQPRGVLIDIDTLTTLPERERLAGYAEVCKYGLLGDAEFWTWLERNGKHVLSGDTTATIHAIETSCAAKASIVAKDEREQGSRALLNLGHTFAHAFEAEAGYSGAILHGEAVAIGMAAAFALSAKLGHCPHEDVERIRAHFSAAGLPLTLPHNIAATSAEKLMAHMSQDKKVKNGKVTFVLARGIGQAFLTQDVSKSDLLSVLKTTLAS